MRELVADAAWHLLNVRNWQVTYALLQTRTAEAIVRLSELCLEYDERMESNKTRLVRHVDVYPGGREVVVYEALRDE